MNPKVNSDDLNFKMDPNKQYSCLSTDFRFVPEKMKLSNDYELKTRSLSFTLAPFFDRKTEGFTIEVLFYPNQNPVPLLIKDFMRSNVRA